MRIEKFVLSISSIDNGEVAILNQLTKKFASQKLKKLKDVKKEFKVYLNNDDDFCFSKMLPSGVEKLKKMLPKVKITI